MRHLFPLFILIFLSGNAFPQLTPRYTYQENAVGYLEYLPPGYDTATQKFALLIYLHGGGEKGDGTPESLEKLKAWGPPALISSGHDMCFPVGGIERCFIVIAPQLNPDVTSWPYVVASIMDHINNGPEHYKADLDRIYLTGMSRGGLGTYQYAASIFNEPNKLAAIAPVAAWSEGGGCTISARNIAVWAFHGQLDTVVPSSTGLAAFNSISNCETPSPEAELIFTVYPDRYHDSWIPAYTTDQSVQSPNLYQWLLTKKRPDAKVPGIVTSTADEHPETFSVHPNPLNGNPTITLQGMPPSGFTVTIFSLKGELLMTIADARGELDLTRLPSGVYVVMVKDHAGIRRVERIVK